MLRRSTYFLHGFVLDNTVGHLVVDDVVLLVAVWEPVDCSELWHRQLQGKTAEVLAVMEAVLQVSGLTKEESERCVMCGIDEIRRDTGEFQERWTTC